MKHTFLFFILNLFFLINVDSQSFNHYQIENDGYINNITVTKHGLIYSNNFGNVLYLNNNKQKEVFSAKGCGFYYTVSADDKYIGFKYIENNNQIPALYDLEKKKLIKLEESTQKCGQISFSNNGLIVYTVDKTLKILNYNLSLINQIELPLYVNIVAISPNGKRIVYNDNNEQLVVMNIDSRISDVITDNANSYTQPQWSFDGEKILYSSLNGKIYIYNTISKDNIVVGEGVNPEWIANTEKIVFQKNIFNNELELTNSDIMIYDYTKKNKTAITSTDNIFEMNPVSDIDGNIYYHTYQNREVVKLPFNKKNQKFSPIEIIIKADKKIKKKIKQIENKTSKNEVNLLYDLPYVNQMYDTPYYDGDYQPRCCAAAAAAMSLAYFNKVPKWPVSRNTPYYHTNDYGNYVGARYYYNENYYNILWRSAYGGYGYMWGDGLSPSRKMAGYINQHDLVSLKDSNCTFTETMNEINNGNPHPLCVMLSSSGHLIVTKGYIEDLRIVIVNDPYGDKNTGTWPNYSGKDAKYDWPSYNNGNMNLVQVPWTVTSRGVYQTQYDSLTIEDNYFNHGFYINNTENGSDQRFYRHAKQGLNGKSWWTYTVDYAQDVCHVIWTPTLSKSGIYNIKAFIPDSADALYAQYKIHYQAKDTTVVVNQLQNKGNWVDLGNYICSNGNTSHVRLGDAALENNKKLFFDAVKYEPIFTLNPAILQLPISGTTNLHDTIRFKWNSNEEDVIYQLQLSKDSLSFNYESGFDSCIYKLNIDTITNYIITNISDSAKYYWTIGTYNKTHKIWAFARPNSFSTIGFDGIFEIDNMENNDIQIFPNPIKDYFLIKYNTNIAGDLRSTIYSSNGVELMTFICKDNEKVNITSLKSGIYYLIMESKNRKYFKKLIKN